MAGTAEVKGGDIAAVDAAEACFEIASEEGDKGGENGACFSDVLMGEEV